MVKFKIIFPLPEKKILFSRANDTLVIVREISG